MGMVYSKTDSGLVLAEHGADGAAVARALKQLDPDLRLVMQENDQRNAQVWKVYRYAGSERPAEFIMAWQTETGEPLPLSMRLVDEVQRLDRNSRATVVDADTANAQLRAQRDKEFADAKEAIVQETASREESGRLYAFHKSPALAAARRRGRRKGTTYDSPWQKRWSR